MHSSLAGAKTEQRFYLPLELFVQEDTFDYLSNTALTVNDDRQGQRLSLKEKLSGFFTAQHNRVVDFEASCETADLALLLRRISDADYL